MIDGDIQLALRLNFNVMFLEDIRTKNPGLLANITFKLSINATCISPLSVVAQKSFTTH